MAKKKDYGAALAQASAAVRVAHEKMGVRKALSSSQRNKAAEAFDANRNSILASKKLIDTRHKAVRKVGSVRSQATAIWKSMTLPYPDPGVRLIRKDRIAEFENRMKAIQGELTEAVQELEAAYGELKLQAKVNLGTLFNDNDYPASIADQFSLSWDYPSVEAPAYLAELSPELYKREQERIKAQFDEAVSLAEQAFAAQLSELTAHLVERLTPSAPGEKKKLVFSATIDNLNKFFADFKKLSIGSNGELDAAVNELEKIVTGVKINDLRNDVTLQQSLKEQLAPLAEKVGALVVVKPGRAFDFGDEE